MNQDIENIIKKNLPEKKEIGHILKCNMCSPKCGFNQALSQINTSLIADKVLKVVVEKIKEYKNKECKESVIDGIKYGLINGEKICDDIISNLSPNKENKNNERSI